MNDGQRSAVWAPAKWTRPSGARSADHAAWSWPGRSTVQVPRAVGVAGPVVRVDAGDLRLGRELVHGGADRRVVGHVEVGRRRPEADEQDAVVRRRHRPDEVEPGAGAHRAEVVRDAPRDDPRLDALAGVVALARRALRGGERGRERDRRQHADRDRDDGARSAVALPGRGRHRHAVRVLLDRGDRRAEHDLAAHVAGDRLVQRRGPGREAPAEHRSFEVAPERVVGGGDPAQEVEHRRVARVRGRAGGDPEQEQLAHARREAERVDPVARGRCRGPRGPARRAAGRRRGGAPPPAARRRRAPARPGRRARRAARARSAPRRATSARWSGARRARARRRSGRPPPRRSAGRPRPRRRPCRGRARRARRAAAIRGRRSGRAPRARAPSGRAPRAHVPR